VGGFTESVTPLPCDQALLVGTVMSADNNKIRHVFMIKNLDSIDRHKLSERLLN
jgi:predicted transcriptional regulator